MFQEIILLNLITLSLSYYIFALNQEQQYYTYSLEITPDTYDINSYFASGVWTRYAPFDGISQVGNIGLFDSNCFNIHYAMDSQSNLINFLYYDCIDANSKLITKTIKFLAVDGNLYNFGIVIEQDQYEFQWFYFSFTQWPVERKLELIIVQQYSMALNEILNIAFPYQSKKLILTFGGGLQIDSNQILNTNIEQNLSYFPGKMVLYSLEISHMEVKPTLLSYITEFFSQNCQCDPEMFYPISGSFESNDMINYISSARNCDQFTFSGWIRILDIKSSDQAFTYQFIKMCSNSQNQNIVNQNLCSFQLFYEISQNLKKIIFTTYSYQLPLVNLDFSLNQNLILKEFEITDIMQWHFLQVVLLDNVFTVQINIFQNQQKDLLIFSQQVKQFHLVQFQFQFGNILQSQSNFLSIEVNNFIYNNCVGQLQDIVCHTSCESCDGPYHNNCLTCNQNQKRVYFQKQKICLCPYGFVDDQICRTYSDYNLQISPSISEVIDQCEFGYFQIEKGKCFQCPTIIRTQIVTCQECVLNPQNWIQNPFCISFLALDQIGSPFQILVLEDIEYIFDGENLNVCQKKCRSNNIQILKQYKNFLDYQQQFQQICLESSSDFNIVQPQRNECYACGAIQYCIRCKITLQGQKCLRCDYTSTLQDGICTEPTIGSIGKLIYNTCQSPYYINSKQGCSLCPIQNCIYCFEYLKDDLTFCTLYSGFAEFDQVESHSVGCALCKDDYIYDFTKGQCISSIPNIPNCSRSYINLQGQEVCTLASIDDFTIAPEINYCQKYISKCQQCILTPQQQIKCIICEDKYTASIKLGFCYPCSIGNAKTCVEGDLKNMDAWVQLIQSFLMQFLPNKYFYPPSGLIKYMKELAISCKDGYALTLIGTCIPECNSNCFSCQQVLSKNFQSTCQSCGLNYYNQPIRSSLDGVCFTCIELCEVCVPRSVDEINEINSNFIIHEETNFFTYKCLKKVNDNRVKYNPYLMNAKYCFDEMCKRELELNVDATCDNIAYLTLGYLDQYYQNRININYCNQMGIEKLIINFSFKFDQNIDNCNFLHPTTIYNNLKQQIFTLQILQCNIFGTQDQNNTLIDSLLIENYNNINISDLNILAPSNNFTLTFLNQFDLLKNIQLQNILFSSVQKTQFFQISAPNQLLQNFNAYNVTLSYMHVQDSIIFNLSASNYLINSLRIINCTFINTTLINIRNSTNLRLFDIAMYNSRFYNSTLFKIQQNQYTRFTFVLDEIILFSMYFENCTIFSNIQEQQTENYVFIIQNFFIFGNNFIGSNLFVTNKNTTMKNINVIYNIFTNTDIFLTDSIEKQIFFQFERWSFRSNVFKNSTIIYLIQSQKISLQIGSFDFYDTMSPINENDYLFQIQAINLTIQQFYMFELDNIKLFYIQQTSQVQFNQIIIKNTDQLFKIKSQLDCYFDIHSSFKLVQVAGFYNIQIFNVEITNLLSFDQSFIQILSDILFNPDTKESISFSNISISKSIILKQNLGNLFSLIAIFSEKIQKIQLYNLTFTQNTFHQYIDDPSQTSAGLVYIGSQQSEVSVDLLQSESNHMTNSTHSFFIFLSQSLQIKNFKVQNHNYKSEATWIEIYTISLDEPLNEDNIYFIIQSIFTIQNIGGAFSITTASLILENGEFYNISAESSAALDIKTQGIGEVFFKNLIFANISVDLTQFVDLSSCINIYSKNSLLSLEIFNASFIFVFNNLGTAILSIVPSQKLNNIILKNIILENCISFTNTLTKIEFQENNIFSNYVQIENLQARMNLQGYQKFYGMLGVFTIEDISKIINDNALINLKGCDFFVKTMTASGVFLQPILKLQNMENLKIYSVDLYQIEQLYSFNLISIIQPTQKMKVQIRNLNIIKTTLISNSYILNITQQTVKKLKTNFQKCQISYKVLQTAEKNNSIISFIESLNSDQNPNQSLVNFYSGSAEINILIAKVTFTQNSCFQNKLNGFNFNLLAFLNLKIKEFQCFKNNFFEYGCLIFQTLQQEVKDSSIIIKNSQFFLNSGGNGVGIFSQDFNLFLDNCQFIQNNSTNQGGAVYFDGKQVKFQITSTIITNNSANQGGGVFINNDQHFNNQNFLNSFLLLNYASSFSNNLNEQPRYLSLSINNLQMKSIQIEKNSTFVQQLEIYPYKIIQQGKVTLTNQILFPSGQTISSFQIFEDQQQKFLGYIDQIQLSFRNSYDEEVFTNINKTCSLHQNIYLNQLIYNVITLDPAYHISEIGRINLKNFTLTFDPFSENTKFSQLQITCPTDNNYHQLIYYINWRSFLCQLGEFYIDDGCQICQSNQGFYSVQYNVTKCSIFDKTKFKSITSNRIELLPGYWRPNLLSDNAELCFKQENFCIGGWEIGDSLCSLGHIGALCEECDIYNTRGQGYFFQSSQSLGCQPCNQKGSNILSFLLTTLWSLLSILLTLRSVEKSNQVYKSLRLGQKYSQILFKLNQDHESILLKMLINYLWIFSIIFTFNINFSVSLHVADSTATPIEFMSNSLDCYLSEIFSIPIMYIKIIFMIILILSELLFISLVYKIISIHKRKKLEKSIISTTAIYLFVSNHASLIKSFCSLLSKRQISEIDYIQSNVSYLFDTSVHQKWLAIFILPGLGINGFLIPMGLFFIIYIQRKKLYEIQRRKYICYLFNEYNSNSYFWEQIKIWLKTVMIVILTYFETDILPKVLFLGISLLLYQILAAKFKPYNIQSLNKIDVVSGQICTFAINLAAINYRFQQENSRYTFVIQLIILILFIQLCIQFLYGIFRVYYKKYRIVFMGMLIVILKKLRISSNLTFVIVKKLGRMKQKQILLQNNIDKLRHYLISVSKVQIEQQRILNTQFSPITTYRTNMNSRENENESKKMI